MRPSALRARSRISPPCATLSIHLLVQESLKSLVLLLAHFYLLTSMNKPRAGVKCIYAAPGPAFFKLKYSALLATFQAGEPMYIISRAQAANRARARTLLRGISSNRV